MTEDKRHCLDWRWQQANRLVETRARSAASRDPQTREIVRFLRAQAAPETAADALRRHKRRWEPLATALAVRAEDSLLPYEIQARILAR